MRNTRQPPDRCRFSRQSVATPILCALIFSVALMACKTETDRSSQRVTSYTDSEKPRPSEPKANPVKRSRKRKSASQKPQDVSQSFPKTGGPAGHLKDQVERLDRAAAEQALELEKLNGESP